MTILKKIAIYLNNFIIIAISAYLKNEIKI